MSQILERILDNDNGKEIDFRCEKNNRTYFVQVANSVADEKPIKENFLLLTN